MKCIRSLLCLLLVGMGGAIECAGQSSKSVKRMVLLPSRWCDNSLFDPLPLDSFPVNLISNPAATYSANGVVVPLLTVDNGNSVLDASKAAHALALKYNQELANYWGFNPDTDITSWMCLEMSCHQAAGDFKDVAV